MKNKLTGVLAATLALTMILPTGAKAFSDGKTTVVSNAEVASQELKKIAAEKAALLTKSHGTTSVQYALIDNGKLTLSGQAGKNDMEGEQPLTKETLYGIGSVSKMYATAAVMKLVDEGKVDLDAPVVNYVPDFKMKDGRYKRITPRMLLNHSSGLQGSTLSNAFLFNDNDTYSHDFLLQQLSNQSLKAEPGAFSVYCNDGFTLAEILVERVSGMSFTEFLHQRFTELLKMNHTKTPQDKWRDEKRAGLYFPAYQGQLPIESVNVIGTGGVSSTAEDMVRFSQLFMGQGKGILSDKVVKAMEQEEYKKGMWPGDGDNIFNYGLGWDSVKLYPFSEYGIKALAKGGDTALQHAILVVLPEQKMAAAVLSSGGRSSTNQLLATELLLAVLKEKGTIKNIKPNKSFGKPVKVKMPQEVAKKAGFYGNSETHFKIEITKNGELFLPSNREEKYVYTADGSFINEKGTSKLNFVTEKNGRTYLKESTYKSTPELGQSAMTHYLAEKLEDNVLSKKTAAAWAKREGVKFYLVNEKFSSIEYLVQPKLITTQITRKEGLAGYWEGRKITGPNTATHQLQIPVMNGRDTTETHFYTEGGNEYMEMAGLLYVSGTNVKPLDASQSTKVTLQANGHAKWFTIPQAAAGKMMTVTLPSKGAFAVYDENGVCVNFTIVSGNNKVKLPKNGTVVIAGAPNSEFAITLN
ncbi:MULTISPECIES: serine hydrolase domain-containing protein [Bacillus cereus group]|uniref:serine hydrolase domain-containing protein n=1 Tax=Bacillus cereus group TaxID=86661 RepID=UPI000BECD6A0|nr:MULTISPECIES: serine hydrolase domain-containing protein [Bacillus cereus group]MBJ7932850.1 beta-lactamase family protein [Bacillus cereus group sp. N31]PEG15489.1 serine hydrolase [Bacillus toyonensis]PHG00204.1 serine hydrolase [Bacillus toyonensis]QWH92281.1 class A beta-lactamase-related serine hydrolase [Bacillus toyonensis]QWI35471.1 class A beta-lactamase-related serine hydrolase [Bacillus toyonensis]